MFNRKLHVLMYAVAGLTVPAIASADIGAPTKTMLIPASKTDLAPTTNGRLRRTDQEQPGNEMAHLSMATATKGFYFSMSTDIGGVPGFTPGIGGNAAGLANNRIQLAMVPFHLEQDVDGSVVAKVDPGTTFITNNNGEERRNANHPIAYQLDAAKGLVAVEYNYRKNGGGNNTERYLQVVDATGKIVMPQTRIYAKNNDDCSMQQDDAQAEQVFSADATTGTYRVAAWRGCNGNGQDDGWMQIFNVVVPPAGGPAKFTQEFDVSLCPREERSRGAVAFVSADPNTMYATWTEGNTQPQRDGTWLAAVDVTPGAHTGNDQQASIIWKKQMDGKKTLDLGNGQTVRTYSMRAMMENVKVPDSTGKLINSDMIIWRSGDVRGNNNGNDGKGGTYYKMQMGVFKLARTGVTPVVPLTDMAEQFAGLDGTHLAMGPAIFGTTDKLQAGVTFIGGSHTGGGYDAQVRGVGFDATGNKLTDMGNHSIATYDRHLYPNYLGNNPGNQGRNFAGSQLVSNPFVGMKSNKDAYLLLFSTTGKDAADMPNPAIKLSAYVSVLPVAQVAPDNTTPTPAPTPDPTPDPTQPNTDPTTGSTDSGTTLGGCSAGGSAGGGALTFLLIGLATFIKRRR